MKDICLVTVNWNNQPCVELLLKSYVKYHYDGEPLNLMLVDNGSTDKSVQWIWDNEIPFERIPTNVGHENGLNFVYEKIKTKYVLLCDTDIEFHDNVFDYLQHIKEDCISIGELIDKNFMNDIHIKDRISPWLWIWDHDIMKENGMKEFRDPTVEDWTYDVGSYHWEKMKEFGFTNHNIPRKHWNQDNEIVSMPYDKFSHIGKVSWDLTVHEDRYSEVMRRRMYVKERLELYKDIDLKNKFI